jgi:hypothetical protein
VASDTIGLLVHWRFKALILASNMESISLITTSESTAVLTSESAGSSAIIMGASDSPSPSLLISSVGAQGPQGDNDNAIAYSIALG